MALFRLRWRAADICSYARVLIGPRQATGDAACCLEVLSQYLAPERFTLC
jgi:hypothetical protein